LYARVPFVGKEWFRDPKEGGFFLDAGSHCFDYLRWIAGAEPVGLYAQVANYNHNGETPRSTMTTLTFANGVMASLWLSYEVPAPGWPRFLTATHPIHFASDATGFGRFQRYLDRHSLNPRDFLIPLEPTGSYGLTVLLYLLSKGYRVLQVENRAVKDYREKMFGSETKTNDTDARLMARMGFLHELVFDTAGAVDESRRRSTPRDGSRSRQTAEGDHAPTQPTPADGRAHVSRVEDILQRIDGCPGRSCAARTLCDSAGSRSGFDRARSRGAPFSACL
jgi:hypothetical protein